MIVWKLSLAIDYKVFVNAVERPKRAAQGVGALLVLCSLYLLSPILALIQIGLIPLILFPTRAIFKRVSNLSRDIFKNNGRRMGLVSECLRNIKSVKVNLFASFYTHRLQSLHEELVAVWKKVFTYDILTSAWGSSLIGPLSLAISFSYSAYAIMENRMTIGALILVISYTPIFLQLFGQLRLDPCAIG
ncbi:ABC transporter transmembrane domain-containing protein [Fusibacter sp. JL298sf-3]